MPLLSEARSLPFVKLESLVSVGNGNTWSVHTAGGMCVVSGNVCEWEM